MLVAALLFGRDASGQGVAPNRVVAGFEIYVEAGRPSAYDYLWEVLPDRIERIRRDLGEDILHSGEIHVLSQLNEWFRQRSEPERAPRWAQALALIDRRTILLKMPDPDPIQTLTHELSHLGVVDAVEGRHVPHWFLEGYARYQADQWGFEWTITIAKAALFGNTLPFEELDTRFPEGEIAVDLAYAQSFHLVRRLLNEHGQEPIRHWLSGIRSGAAWKEAFREAFGLPVEAVYEEWERSVSVWYAWIPAITSLATTWTALALLAVWVGRRVGTRRRRRLEAMAQNEAKLYRPDPDDDLFG